MKQTILILLFRCVSWSQAAASSPLGSLSLYKRYRRPSPSCRRDGSCFLANTFYCTRSNNNHRIYPRLILATKIVPSIHKRWENTGSNYVLAVSRSKSKSIDEMTKRNNQADNSGTRTKKKRSNGVVNCSANKGRRMKKSEIDDLVRGMYLPDCFFSTNNVAHFVHYHCLKLNRNWFGASCTDHNVQKEEQGNIQQHPQSTITIIDERCW